MTMYLHVDILHQRWTNRAMAYDGLRSLMFRQFLYVSIARAMLVRRSISKHKCESADNAAVLRLQVGWVMVVVPSILKHVIAWSP